MDGRIFHICNRGMHKQSIFRDGSDYLRFLESMYRFNNKDGAVRFEGGAGALFSILPPQEKIVDILKWSLLPNHYHLLVCERTPGAAIEFAKRLGNGYTKYVNIKYEQSGYLFQNKAKIIPVEQDAHFLYLPLYVELNPLDLLDNGWRSAGVRNVVKALKFLEAYPWSSFQSYFGESEYAPLTSMKEFHELFETGKSAYRRDVIDFIKKPVDITAVNVPRQRGTLTAVWKG